jgi:hypothetical protein
VIPCSWLPACAASNAPNTAASGPFRGGAHVRYRTLPASDSARTRVPRCRDVSDRYGELSPFFMRRGERRS